MDECDYCGTPIVDQYCDCPASLDERDSHIHYDGDEHV